MLISLWFLKKQKTERRNVGMNDRAVCSFITETQAQVFEG